MKNEIVDEFEYVPFLENLLNEKRKEVERLFNLVVCLQLENARLHERLKEYYTPA